MPAQPIPQPSKKPHQPKPVYSEYGKPDWLINSDPHVFRLFDQAIYAYMTGFPEGECPMMNYWLQKKFHRSRRTIQRSLARLTKLHCISRALFHDLTRPISPKLFKTIRRIYVHRFHSEADRAANIPILTAHQRKRAKLPIKPDFTPGPNSPPKRVPKYYDGRDGKQHLIHPETA